MPLAILREPSGSLVSLRSEGVWTWRLLDSAQPQLGTVVANLDVSEFLQQRRELALELGLVGLAISVLGACLLYTSRCV